MNKKIALSTLSILSSLSLVAGATFAFFSDVGTSSENTFSTGTLDLKLSDDTPETDQDSVIASFGSKTLAPGSCTGTQKIRLKNSGTIAADHAEVHLANVVTDANENATPDMDSYLRINSLTYDGSDVLSQIPDQEGDTNAFVDLADWAVLGPTGGLDNLGLANLGTNHPLVMDVCLDSSAPNEIQGDSVVSTLTIDLNQDASQ